MLRTVLFDFNGVIIDDEHLHMQAFAEVASEEGLSLTKEDYYGKYLGLDDKGCITAALRDSGRDPEPVEVTRLIERKAEVYFALLENGMRIFSGAAELVRSLAAELPLAIASGARRREVETVLRRIDLSNCFGAVVTADEIQHGKPDPEGYLTGLELLRQSAPEHASIAAEECLVIEDAPPGIRSAHAAGMRCVAVASSRPEAELSEADLVVSSLEGLDLGRLRTVLADG